MQAKKPFNEFVYSVLVTSMPEDFARKLTEEGPLENYFRRAFTHKTFYMSKASSGGSTGGGFDYEVLEKIGDRVLSASFNLWLHEIIGLEVAVPQVYNDIEQKLTNTKFLSDLANKIGFSKYIAVATDGNIITDNMKEDVFEAFVAAIVLAADEYIVKDIGFGLAKRWIFQVYNTYARDSIDTRSNDEFVNYTTRVNDIWMFNGWGAAIYKHGAAIKGQSATSLIGPNHDSFPEKYRGKEIGRGSGADKAKSKEEASRNALKNLDMLSGIGEDTKIDKILAGETQIFKQLEEITAKSKGKFGRVVFRTIKIHTMYVAQLRVQVNGVWTNDARGRSSVSEKEAALNAVRYFISKASDTKFRK